MIKPLIPVLLTFVMSLVGLSPVVIYPVQAQSIVVYSISSNRNGRILETSIGRFYIGKSGDAIHEASGRRRYGYWQQNSSRLVVYIDDNVYTFYL